MEIIIIETGELVSIDMGNEREGIDDIAKFNEKTSEWEMTEEQYEFYTEYYQHKMEDAEEIITLAKELDLEQWDIINRLNEECNPLDPSYEHSENQRIFAKIREENK